MSTMVPMYGFGGGIDNLKFRVYAATSLPASGKENDVCIITSTPIPSWEAGQVDNPTWSMDAGFVYLTCSASDVSQPNLLRKNALYLKLTRCWQYESGKWATKNAYQYRNGAWVQFSTTFRATIHVTYPAGYTCTATNGTTTLTAPDTSGTWKCVVRNAGTWTVSLNSGFKETVNVTVSGNTYTLNKWHIFNGASDCTAVSGGWTAEAKKTSSDTQAYAAKPGITQGSNYIKFSIGANLCGMVYTTKKVSLKGIKTIKVSGTLANAGGFDHSLMMTVWSSIGTYCDDNNAAEAGTTPGTTANSLSLNVSSLSGSYYIGFKFNTRNGSASYASITEFSLIC